MSSTNRGAVREERDFYPTPKDAFLPLIPFIRRHEDATVHVWDPAMGDGRLVKWMNEDRRGIVAHGSDLEGGIDFLADETTRECIVTNPPYSLGGLFVRHAVAKTYCARATFEAFLLLRLNFLGSKCRKEWFQRHEPNALFVLSERPSFVTSLKCKACDSQWTQAVEMERPKSCPKCGGPRPKATSSDSTEYAWFYWGARHRGIFHL